MGRKPEKIRKANRHPGQPKADAAESGPAHHDHERRPTAANSVPTPSQSIAAAFQVPIRLRAAGSRATRLRQLPVQLPPCSHQLNLSPKEWPKPHAGRQLSPPTTPRASFLRNHAFLTANRHCVPRSQPPLERWATPATSPFAGVIPGKRKKKKGGRGKIKRGKE